MYDLIGLITIHKNSKKRVKGEKALLPLGALGEGFGGVGVREGLA
ncbi:hypothetical protein CCP4SC76_5330029 [Gammaproteobacteria bacterium]